MKTCRIFAALLILLASPFLLYTFFYMLRWVLTGVSVVGGGDRAAFGVMFGILLLFPVPFLLMED